jgi:hypothetical protein
MNAPSTAAQPTVPSLSTALVPYATPGPTTLDGTRVSSATYAAAIALNCYPGPFVGRLQSRRTYQRPHHQENHTAQPLQRQLSWRAWRCSRVLSWPKGPAHSSRQLVTECLCIVPGQWFRTKLTTFAEQCCWQAANPHVIEREGDDAYRHLPKELGLGNTGIPLEDMTGRRKLRPRGMNGPHSIEPCGAAAAATSSGESTAAVATAVASGISEGMRPFLAAMIPRTPSRRGSSSRRHASFSPGSPSPRIRRMIRGSMSPSSTPTRGSRGRVTPRGALSCVPNDGDELSAFLEDLHTKRGLDFRAKEGVLGQLDYTPDVIPLVDVTELKAVLATTPGKVLKLRQFATRWNEELQASRV